MLDIPCIYIGMEIKIPQMQLTRDTLEFPEKNLLTAMLERAYLDLYLHDPKTVREAASWILDDNKSRKTHSGFTIHECLEVIEDGERVWKQMRVKAIEIWILKKAA